MKTKQLIAMIMLPSITRADTDAKENFQKNIVLCLKTAWGNS